MGAGVTATDGVGTGSTAVSVERALVAFVSASFTVPGVSGLAPTSALVSGSLRSPFTLV